MEWPVVLTAHILLKAYREGIGKGVGGTQPEGPFCAVWKVFCGEVEVTSTDPCSSEAPYEHHGMVGCSIPKATVCHSLL